MMTKGMFGPFISAVKGHEELVAKRGTADASEAGRPSGGRPAQRSVGSMLAATVVMLGALGFTGLVAPTPAAAASIAVGISVGYAPPPLPVYTLPPCPGPGFIWTPGYWAFDPDNGYYWVPGTWVLAPEPGFLWTPGYWGWSGVAFIWHGGYWGPHVGFYGGIDYGFGYPGMGFVGGEWRGREFYYNRAVYTNIRETHITNVYYNDVRNDYRGGNRVSYNGGRGGLNARPSRFDLAASHERHFDATQVQREHQVAARSDRRQFDRVNHGRPEVAATQRPGEFRGGNENRSGEFHGSQGNLRGYPHSPSPYSAGGNREGMSRSNSPSPRRQEGMAREQRGGMEGNNSRGYPHSPSPYSTGGNREGVSRSNPPAPRGYDMRGQQPQREMRNAPPSRNEISRGPANRTFEAGQRQPQERNPRPSQQERRPQGHPPERNR